MTALTPLTDVERESMQADLELTRSIRAAYMVRLRREQLAGGSVEKLRVQVDACDRWIAMYEKELAA